ncbi:MAG: cytidylate kinase family protein [bacterium]
MNIKYKNIIVSGLPGAGSTTLAKKLAKKLGWEYFSGGDWMRAYAVTNGLFDGSKKIHHDQSIIQDEIDRKMDHGMRRNMFKKDEKIYDSWLCGFLAQGVPGTFKILCMCSDDRVRVDRLANRDELTIKQAKEHIFDREKKNVAKWRKMYKKEWEEWVVKPGFVKASKKPYYWYPEMYDLVIDTFKVSKEEAMAKAWEFLSGKIA